MKRRVPCEVFWVVLVVLGAATVARAAEWEDAFKYLKTYRFGDFRAPLNPIEEAVVASTRDAALRAQLEQHFAEILKEGTADAKRYACRHLAVIGTERSVPALAALLEAEEASLRDAAIFALEHIPGPEATQALLDALHQADGAGQIALVHALERRKDAAAVGDLAGLLKKESTDVAVAAAYALASIATPEAWAALREARTQAEGTLRVALDDAALKAAEALAADGNKTEARALYEELYASRERSPLRAAALSGLLRLEPTTALDKVLSALEDPNEAVVRAAMGFMRDLPGEDATKAIVALLPKSPTERKVALLHILADRADGAAREAITAAAAEAEPAVRTAALMALGQVGNADTVPLLLQAAASGSTEERRVARESLTRLHGDDVNAALLQLAEAQGDAAMRAEALRALSDRRAVEVRQAVLALAERETAPVQGEALSALSVLGTADELPQVIALLEDVKEESTRQQVESCIAGIAARVEDSDLRLQAILVALRNNPNSEVKASLVRVLGTLGGDTALAVMREGIKNPEALIRKTCLEVLGRWSTDEPLDDLLQVAQAGREEDRATAWASYANLLVAAKNRPLHDLLARYETALAEAKEASTKRRLLSGLATLYHVTALELARSYTKDKECGKDAEDALVRLAAALAAARPDLAVPILEEYQKRGDKLGELAKTTLERRNGFGEYVVSWEMSGPYKQEGMTATMLFDVGFEPEFAPEKAEWRILPVGLHAERPYVLDLGKIFTDDQECVLYLRTTITAPAVRDVILEMGSNDGCKVWLNGTGVFGNNVGRTLTCGEDKVPLRLQEGRNDLMLAIYQQGGEWQACVRLTALDGSPQPDLRVAVPSALGKP